MSLQVSPGVVLGVQACVILLVIIAGIVAWYVTELKWKKRFSTNACAINALGDRVTDVETRQEVNSFRDRIAHLRPHWEAALDKAEDASDRIDQLTRRLDDLEPPPPYSAPASRRRPPGRRSLRVTPLDPPPPDPRVTLSWTETEIF